MLYTLALAFDADERQPTLTNVGLCVDVDERRPRIDGCVVIPGRGIGVTGWQLLRWQCRGCNTVLRTLG